MANNRSGGGALIGYQATAEQCVFSNNLNSITMPDAFSAGGVAMNNRGSFLRNCLICNNTNTYTGLSGGGGLVVSNASEWAYNYIYNCTIVNNWSTNYGGGINMRGPALASSGNPAKGDFFYNCVIAGNVSPSNADVYIADSINTNRVYYCCVNTNIFAPNQGNITNDPVFVNPSAGNWRLANNSPAMNKGTNQSWMTNGIDMDGRSRIRYGRVDMGAYETIYEGTMFTVP